MITNISGKYFHEEVLEKQYWKEKEVSLYNRDRPQYVYTIECDNVSELSQCIIDYNCGDHCDSQLAKEQFDYIYSPKTDTGCIRLYAHTKPTVDIPIEFLVVDVCFR